MDLFAAEVELFESAFLSAFSLSDGPIEDRNEIASPGPSTSSNGTNELVTVSNEDQQQLDVILHDLEPMSRDELTFLSEEITQFLDHKPTNRRQQSSCAYENSSNLGCLDSRNVYQQAQDWTQLTSCAYQQVDNSVVTNDTAIQQDTVDSGHTHNSCRYSYSTLPPMKFHVQYPDSSNTRKRKRVRTAFTTSQLFELENLYRRNNYLERMSRLRLAERMQLDEKVIKVWFQNRRMKEKRQESGEA